MNAAARALLTLLHVAPVTAAWIGIAMPSTARACSASTCSEGSYHLTAGAKLPANLPALRWRPPEDYIAPSGDLAVLHLTRIGGGEASEVPLKLEPQADGTQLARLVEELVVGARYRLSVETDLPCAPEPIDLLAVEAAPLPAVLGRIVIATPQRGDVHVATTSGSCNALVPAVMADVKVDLAAEAEPWTDLLQFKPVVDEGAWQPQWTISWDEPYDFGPGETLLFSRCAGPRAGGRPVDERAYEKGLPQGEHAFRFEATLPGVEGVLRTADVPITLECGAEPEASAMSTSMAGAGAPEPARKPAPGGDGHAQGADKPSTADKPGTGASADRDPDAGVERRGRRSLVDQSGSSGCSALGGRNRGHEPGWAAVLAACTALLWLARGRARARRPQ